MTFPLPQPIFLLLFVCAFVHFFLAGARTFERSATDDLAGSVAQVSFIGTGAFATGMLGFRVPIPLWNGIGSAILLLFSLLLYEWARHAISGRGFHIAWSSDVPETVCEAGPYGFIRHPLYLAYILAFLAAYVALPKIAMFAIFLANAALFTHAAFSDERSLATSALSVEYSRYKRRTGMFFPRLTRQGPAHRDKPK